MAAGDCTQRAPVYTGASRTNGNWYTMKQSFLPDMHNILTHSGTREQSTETKKTKTIEGRMQDLLASV